MTETTSGQSALQAEGIDPGQRALIVVDVQPDFMPGGPLACAEGDALLPGLQALLSAHHFGHVVATQDWHPADHISFASRHPGWRPFESTQLYGESQTLWPDHCLQGSPGAALHPAIDWSRADTIIRKGTDRRIDSYSGFRHNLAPDGSRPPTGLAGWLRERGVTHVWLCGLARDVCVLWTAEDAVLAGFETRFLWSLTRPVSFESDADTRQRLQQQGIDIVDADFMDPV
ncbi:nicotinamidase/pyrazinamidase [Kushneria sinocarnis]|uniref:nicotinamidase n=1 Tax=Kushneria sinocarnis TaxID=595502 RepID=A0A420X058_9GAMM|nr:nicotinamidase [Kushneria sinocarnis]RKR06924.1 nicotinamidase/pyrazinamidase [Kushneria sinocarnis]